MKKSNNFFYSVVVSFELTGYIKKSFLNIYMIVNYLIRIKIKFYN